MGTKVTLLNSCLSSIPLYMPFFYRYLWGYTIGIILIEIEYFVRRNKGEEISFS
jgi:hypothetical protein